MPKSAAIPADRVTILFLVMLVAAAGNTAMQSALPAIASQLKIADVWVSLAFSWSALLWVLTAPKWARQSDKRGRKLLMTVGVIGFVASMGLCGLVLWLGLEGFIAPAATFIIFAIFRSLYGGFGSAAPPAVQAYIAARTEREERAKALSLLASSFGLGTVIGPALAHFLIFEPFGLAGPLVVFASFGVLVLIGLKLRLPNDTPRFAARGIVTSYPSAASVNQPEVEEGVEEDNALPREEVRLPWRDARLASWLMAGLIGGHAQAIMLGVVGFLVRDRLGLHDLPKETVEATGSVMFVGAMATLLAQWGLIPILSIGPRASILWGSFLALLGIALVGVSFDFYGITLGFALASLGFGLYRPGFNAGASLAVRRFEQGDVAGKIASINGSAYIVTPAIGIALFNWWEPATFLLMAAALLYLIVWGRKALDDTPKPLDS
ncbi:MAG: MFS transporter [Sphingomonadales bacterium]|jgi:MFS family permease|nr:MFS transporter [Sphingomonadales bacterium]MBK9002769.1 MFS transporter [Sphingomonadales bacterium]MBK9267993.1 MFS transporter [Sphingomonadales bacterium]MBP6434193.1 MFS transporter [Sphingorhabdus sp.]